jgi:prepilin-type N-terminal cleavage/methylation domain-containing protein
VSARDGHRSSGGERGFTLIELMISLVIAGLAVGFIFRIYATSSVAYRTQSQVAELQQTLRTAKQLLTKELRMAGYYAGSLSTAIDTGVGDTSSGAFLFQPIQVTNSSTGPDGFTISYADTTCSARVSADKNSSFKAADTRVDRTDCFVDGDIVAAVRTSDGTTSKKGQGCVLQITGVQDAASRVNHNPGQGLYNSPGNDQCSNIDQDWTDGHTVFVKFRQKAYRIKPNDARGVLQVLPAGSTVWQDLAFGFVDMQVAIQAYDSTDPTDQDGDGSGPIDWYSGPNLGTIPSTATMLQMRISLVARTIAEVEGVGTLTTPLLIDPTNLSRPNNNMVGDRPSVTLASITDKTSPLYGNYVYRMVTTVVDLRNIGTGQEQ